MSCEEDDDWWDDPEPIVEVKNINIENTTISKEELLKIQEALTICLDRKLEKLNLLLKQMNIYQFGNSLIVNDRYNIALNFIEIVKNFGMDISLANLSGLKGKTYVISDKITKLLEILNNKYNFNNVVNILNTPVGVEINNLVVDNYKYLDNIYDLKLCELLKEIKLNGFVSISGTETFVNGISQGIVSDNDNITTKLKDYLKLIKQEICNNNKNLQYGTIEIIYTRARQMGYSVEKVVKGKEVQLVLERIEV